MAENTLDLSRVLITYPVNKGKRSTLVAVKDIETGRFLLGYALCNKRDNFCKETGITIALNRAYASKMKRWLFPNSIKKEVLEAFQKRAEKYFRTDSAVKYSRRSV